MRKYYTYTRFFLLVLLVQVGVSCRKKIDFSEGERLEEGALSPNETSYEPWITVPTEGITDIQLIEQDYNGIYFTGVKNNLRTVFYFEGENAPTVVWYGNSASTPNGEFTLLEFSAPNMYIANNILPYAKLRIYPNPSSGTQYTFNLAGKKITGVKSIGNDMYLSGDFEQGSPFPASSYFDKVDKTSGYFLGMSGLEAPAEAQCYGLYNFFACGKNVHSGRSIANWDGTQWVPHSTLTVRVTDVEMLQDTLFVAGNLPNGKAILKERNGYESTFNELINTAQTEAETNIRIVRYGQKIFAYGTVNFENYSFFSVLKYENGRWSYVGRLNEIPTDIAFLDGYLYAATASGIKKIAA